MPENANKWHQAELTVCKWTSPNDIKERCKKQKTFTYSYNFYLNCIPYTLSSMFKKSCPFNVVNIGTMVRVGYRKNIARF